MGRGSNEKGITLVEMLVALALVSVVFSGLMGVYWVGSKSYENQAASSDAQYAARMAAQIIVEDIRGAAEAETQEEGAKLRLLTASGEDVVYYRQANNWLYRDGNAKTPIAENITGLSFTRNNSLFTLNIDATVNGFLYSLSTSANRRSNYIEIAQHVIVDSQGNIWAADDGTNWQRVADGFDVRDVVWNGSMFVAVGENVIYTSSDGINWTLTNTDYDTNAVTWGNDMFVAVSSKGDGRVITSTDGINWVDQNAGANGHGLNDVTSGNDIAEGKGIFVAVGDFQKVFFSSDGVNWGMSDKLTKEEFNGVAYGGPAGNEIFVAVGTNGTIYSSSDGENWIEKSSGVTQTLNSVTWGNNVFVIVGKSGTILTSTDGAEWVKRTSGVTNDLTSVTSSNGQFIIVGDGVILQSSDGITWIETTSNF